MLFHSLGQPFILVACLCAGLIDGAVYDLLYVVRRLFRFRTAVTVLADLIFSAAVFITAFTAFYISNDMQIEWYMPPCVGAGLLLYRWGVRKVLLFLGRLVYNKYRKLRNSACNAFRRKEGQRA